MGKGDSNNETTSSTHPLTDLASLVQVIVTTLEGVGGGRRARGAGGGSESRQVDPPGGSTLLSHRKRINEDDEDEKPDERREQAPLPSHQTRGPERVGCGQLPRTEADGKTRDLPVIFGD